jgi:hypothetical protein
MKEQLNEIKRIQQLAGILKENQLNEEVTIFQPGQNLGAYSPADGDLSAGLKDDCTVLGTLTDIETNTINAVVFEGSNYVCILTPDSGYGAPAISIHDKSVLKEIQDRIQK